MKRACCVFLLCSLLYSCKKSNAPAHVTPPDTTGVTQEVHIDYRGADLSFLPEIEQAGTQFYDTTGAAKTALTIFKNYGCNLVRVRLWHVPASDHSALPEVLAFCKRINDAGLQILLDIHYSDTWADPGQQAIPAAWAGLAITALQDSVKTYTQRVIGLLKAQNTMPAIVQVGNEINGGFLWPQGKITGNSDANWANFATLIKSGIAGIKAVDTDNSISIMLHYAELDGASGFYSNMVTQGVQFDMIGLSYYPWWAEKDLAYIQSQLNNLAPFNKKIFIVETAYPFTLSWNDNTNNSVGEASQLIPAYGATPQGQLMYLEQLKTMLAAIPNKLGAGLCYWAPDWVAFRGATATNGSNAENLALFDFNNKALAGLKAYKE